MPSNNGKNQRIKRRTEAEARQTEYNALSDEDKAARHAATIERLSQ